MIAGVARSWRETLRFLEKRPGGRLDKHVLDFVNALAVLGVR